MRQLSLFPRIVNRLNVFQRKTVIESGQKSDILLVTTPPWGIHNPPLGLAYLATYLRSNGIATGVFDFNIALYRKIPSKWHKLWLPEYKNWWSNPEHFKELKREFSKDIEWAIDQIARHNTAVIGFSVVDPKERTTIAIIQKILEKNPSKKIILGGPAVSTPEQRNIFNEYLGAAIDYFVIGEGESILLELMRAYKSNSFNLGSETETTSPGMVRKEIRDLNSLPYPTYSEFDLTMYDGGSLFVEWSRGCISACAYCKGRQLHGRYRMKRARYIVDELEFHWQRYHNNYFIVCDNLLNGNIRELERVCDLLIEKKLPIKWEGQAIPHRKMTSHVLNKMKAAGCCKLQWGLESGSDNVLQNIRKGNVFKVHEAEEVIRCCHCAGIRTELFIMVGLPGEDDTEFRKTEGFIRRNQNYIDLIKSINTVHLVHGTDLYDCAEDYGISLPEKDWYYLWHSKDGQNDYPCRVERARSLIHLAENLGIKVQEHNLYEGVY